MALADYFQRNATAVAQLVSGLDEALLADKLSDITVGISFGRQALGPEGQALLDLMVRILARLYPTLVFRPAVGTAQLEADLIALARSINPSITISNGEATVGIAIGEDAPQPGATPFYAGSHGWDALLSVTGPRPVGNSTNPFGAGTAACFACANVFRSVILDRATDLGDRDLVFSTLERQAQPSQHNVSLDHCVLEDGTVLIGVGAVGNAAAWALSRTPLIGRLHLVDHETVELSNLQRYVLAARQDEGRSKVELAQAYFKDQLEAVPNQLRWGEFVEQSGYSWSRVLVAVDSARDRRAIQSSLPRWVANAWTQPGDLGISIHAFEGEGACLSCLYLPQHGLTNEDELIAGALGIPDRLMQIRQLLYHGVGAPQDLLIAAAERLEVPPERMLAFEGRPVRALYTEGVCGGAVVPLSRVGRAPQDVHVPLAHQSALAGVLLSAALAAEVAGYAPATTTVTRIDLMRPLAEHLTQPALKDGRGICICQDTDYRDAYRRKYHPSALARRNGAASPRAVPS